MTKKEYCINNKPIASHDYYVSHIHGIEYDINDYVYVSEVVQKTYCGPKSLSFHKCKIYYDADGDSYFNIIRHTYDGRTYRQQRYISEYIKRGEWLPEYNINDWTGEIKRYA